MSAYEPQPDPEESRPQRDPSYDRGLRFALFMLMFTNTLGLILVLVVPVLLVFGQSAGDAIAFAVCGLGLITWSKR